VSYNLSLTGAAAPTNGWNLISNPYPSPVLVSQVINSAGASNVDNMLYVFDSNANTNVIYSASGSNSVIPMGQAFAIRALVNPVVFSPIETWKTPTNSNVGLLKTSASYTPNYFFDDFLIDLSSTSISAPFFSSAYFTFDPSATTGFDNGKDAFLIGNSVDPGLPYIYSNTSGQKYVRNALPSLSGTVIVPLTVKSGTTGVFKFTPLNMNKLPAGACVNLYDIVKGTLHDLKTGPYTGTVTANATIPQFELRITVTPGTLTSSQNNPVCLNSNNGLIIAQGSSSGPWNYTWKDGSNTILKVSTNKATADTLYNLNIGTYQVDVNSTGFCDNANATFSLVSSSPLPSSSFTVNNDTLNIFGPTQFVFTNNSSNANSYFWTFGDGNTSTVANPTYMYSNPGTYNVTLYAINSVCGDTTAYNFTVYAVMSTGVSSLAVSDNSINIGKDANGMYVELNYEKGTKATISVTNVLGQVLMAPKTVEGTHERYYVDVNAKDQVLFITVVTDEQRITKRFFSN
jgi:PKD repeat protein